MKKDHQSDTDNICAVSLPLPVEGPYHYLVPDRMKNRLKRGCRVKVPFGHRTETGYVVDFTDSPDVSEDRLKEIDQQIDDEPLITGELFSLTRWISSYYLCSWGQVLEAAIPGAVRSGTTKKQRSIARLNTSVKKAVERAENLPDRFRARRRVIEELIRAEKNERPVSDLIRDAGCSRSPVQTLEENDVIRVEKRDQIEKTLYDDLPEPDPVPESLTDPQEQALEKVTNSIQEGNHDVFLLHGVTGSGKTEVYIRAIQQVIEQDQQGIVLLPEISLTPQALARFRDRFDSVAVLHSYLSAARRRDEWHRIRSGEANVVLGARSSVFAPVPDPGIIVVDEEHDSSFKQTQTPRYNARDVAVLRGDRANCPVLLGSATPSLESLHNARSDKYTLLRLPERIGNNPLPEIQAVDMTEQNQSDPDSEWSPLSETMEIKIRRVLQKDGQVMLFLNRRGFASYIFCPSCREVVRCQHCELAMTYHKQADILRCHRCQEFQKLPNRCPECGKPELLKLGMGTERIESTLENTFPDRTIRRMDSDTMTTMAAYERAVSELQEESVDILVGTQMIAKGLHFPGVELVGIVSADTSLHLSDFRSAERTFQLITQISGRTGRGSGTGTVILQSFNVDHYSIQTAIKHDYHNFCNRELEQRKSLGYPPFQRILRILVRGSSEEKVGEKIRNIHQEIQPGCNREDVRILGPSPAPISKIRNRFRHHMLLQLPRAGVARHIYENHWDLLHPSGSIDVVLDMDPQTIL